MEALTSSFAPKKAVVIWFDVFSCNQHRASLEAVWFDVAMCADSIEQFESDVETFRTCVIKTLAMIDTSKSECSKPDDRVKIHEQIQRTVGFHNKGSAKSWETGWFLDIKKSRDFLGIAESNKEKGFGYLIYE